MNVKRKEIKDHQIPSTSKQADERDARSTTKNQAAKAQSKPAPRTKKTSKKRTSDGSRKAAIKSFKRTRKIMDEEEDPSKPNSEGDEEPIAVSKKRRFSSKSTSEDNLARRMKPTILSIQDVTPGRHR